MIRCQRRPRPNHLRAVAVFALGSVAIAACGGSEDTTVESQGKPSIAVAFFPIADAAERIAGDAVEIVNLTPAGVSPHELQLLPRDRAAAEGADAVIYLGSGFQPDVEALVRAVGDNALSVDLLDVMTLLPVTDALAGVEGDLDGEVLEGGLDPHAWVSLRAFGAMVSELTEVLIALAPDQADEIRTNSAAYLAEIAALDARFEQELSTCESRILITSHRAFEYMAQDYALVQIPIAGVTPDAEPSPRSIEAIANFARAEGVTTIFFEDALPTGLVDTIARETAAAVDLLSPIETIDADDVAAGATYLSIQEDNLDALTAGLRCGG